MISVNVMRRRVVVGVAAGAMIALAWNRPAAAEATGARGMVATVNPLATEAGVDVLKSGGNAIDAAIAAGLTLGVVDGHNSGIGGGCFMLIRLADGSFVEIDGREVAPASATADMFVRDGKGDTSLSQNGPLASGVPGAVAAYEYASKHFGNKTLKDVIAPAAALAERGFTIDAGYAKRLAAAAPELAKFEGSREVLLKDGKPRVAGETLRQADLAKTYRGIGDRGADYFYRGPVAEAVGSWMASHGGQLTAKDFADYRVRLREPLVSTYRGYTVVGFPPPSSGGVHVAEVLNILEHFDVGGLEKTNPALRVHVMAEAMKLAFADRAYFLGDPAFVPVPRGLVDPRYAADLAKKISLDHVTKVEHGSPPNPQDVFSAAVNWDKHTTHIATADAAGNWVAMTQTVNTGFGSKVIVPGTGVILNNEMDDFSIQPGVANHFGLVGSAANAVAPGKRPLSSMSPTIVLKDGTVVMSVGAAGGPRIISQVILGISNVIDLGDRPGEALARGRFHHQWSPDELYIEKGLADRLGDQLRARGHVLSVSDTMGASQMIEVIDGKFVGENEPRVPGKAMGF